MAKNLTREIIGTKRVVIANAVRPTGGKGYNTFCFLYLHGDRELIENYFPGFDFVAPGQGFFKDFVDQESLVAWLEKKEFSKNGKGCFVKLM